MSLDEKKSLLQRLEKEVAFEQNETNMNHPMQDNDFDNPFNTAQPKVINLF